MNKTRCLFLSQSWRAKVHIPKLRYRIGYRLCIYPSCERCNSYYTRQYPTNHYKVLGLERNATYEDIKKAYITLSKQHHPDVSSSPGSQKKFIQIREAYDVLSNSSSRQKFDDQLFPKRSDFNLYEAGDTKGYTQWKNSGDKFYNQFSSEDGNRADYTQWKKDRVKVYNRYKMEEDKNEKFRDRRPFVFMMLGFLSIAVYIPVWKCLVDFVARPSTRENLQSAQSWLYFKKRSLKESEKKQGEE